MTAVQERAQRPTSPARTLNVVRLQFINRQTFVWVPLIVLGGAWTIMLLIFWIVDTASGGAARGVVVNGAAQAPLWYFLVVGTQAMTLTFPFSQAMSLTRREFFVGSLAAAAVSAAGIAVLFVLIGLLELATDGYGVRGHFAYLEWVWEAGPLAAWLAYFTMTMLFFVVGFWFSTLYKRFSSVGLTLAILAVTLLLVGFAALVTFQQAWPQVWQWILDTGALGLTLWGILLTAVLAAGSYLTLRRLPA
ncbi:hypothetical protein [Microbacterium album]|uniref:Uncharacterized protein n=1 Tax=Microbacterium album TaxID=2053191 RepID=A0A917IIG6_9MICO|nr:hypothetical protein [Microbacterium album]GGH51444.1 hypothetical protein GCM10010921_30860 [Microbacterium album]